MLDQDNDDLVRYIQEIQREIERTNKERLDQKTKYETEITRKDETIRCKCYEIIIHK